MFKKLVFLVMMMLSLSACGSASSPNADIASLYTGYEEGTWYKFSSNCSAKLCPAY